MTTFGHQTVTTDWHMRYDRTVSSLVREMLNVTDALLVDENQRKAAGKLVKKAIYDEMDYLRNYLVKDIGLPESKGGANHNVGRYERESSTL
jgi:hypothetical protein